MQRTPAIVAALVLAAASGALGGPPSNQSPSQAAPGRAAALPQALVVGSAVPEAVDASLIVSYTPGPCDPFPSLGVANVTSGTVVVDTTTLTWNGQPGGVDIGGLAVYFFDGVSVAAGAAIRGIGTRPLVIVSRSVIQVSGAIHVDGSNATPTAPFCQARTPSPGGAGGGNGGLGVAPSPGPGQIGGGPGGGGPGPQGTAGAGGAGFGGAGGGGGGGNGTPGAGGAAYGDLLTALQGGSGGGGAGTQFGGCQGASGGGGGGALLLVARASITIAPTGSVRANGGAGALSDAGGSAGGSGGAVALFSRSIVNDGAIQANGAGGGNGGCCGGGGGGGGGRVLVVGTASGAGTRTANGGGASSGSSGGGAAGTAGVLQSDPVYAAPLGCCGPVTFSPSALPGALTGVAYSQTITVSNGVAPYGFALAGGGLPPGLTLSSAGVLSGTPTATGLFTFTVGVTETATSCQQEYEYSVLVSCPALALAPASLAPGVAGTAYAAAVTASGGTAPYTYLLAGGSLPTGVGLDPATGALSGTPATSGVYSFTVEATDTYGCERSQTYALTIACGSVSISPATLPAGTRGVAYSQALTASGGVAPYSFTLTGGQLPPGITLSPAGYLSGTPTAGGTYSPVLTAADANGCFAARAYTLAIACATVTLSPASLPGGTVGTAFSQTITAAGGPGAPTFAVTAGALPPGLALAAGGALSGTPTLAGSFSFTVTATDGAPGCSGSLAYAITVSCPSITLAPAALPPATEGAVYSQNLTVTGGTGPYVYSLSGGTLPPGLTLDAVTGLLSGTPTVVGVFSFSLEALDVYGCAGTLTGAITVGCPYVGILPATVPNGTQGTFYSQTLTASGGAGPYAFTLTGGQLPPGLTLGASGYLSGTPTLGGTYGFTVTAQDSGACFAARTYSLVVDCVSLAVSPASLPSGRVGDAYSQTITAAGGTVAPTFAVTAGSVPPGLTLSPGGLLAGTPTLAGTFAFTVTATSGTCTGSQNYVVVVSVGCAQMTLAPANPVLPDAATCGTYRGQFLASGATPPYTYSIAAGALPGGLTLAPDGTLAGLPGTAGSFGFTVAATDATGCVTTRAYSLKVTGAAGATSTGTTTLCLDAIGTATVTTAAGATYEWFITSHTGSGVIVGPNDQATVTYQATAPGVFAITCKVTAPGLACPAFTNLDITVLDGTAPVVTAPSQAAPATTGLVASVPAHAGSTYAWAIENGVITAGQGTASITFTAGYAGWTKLTATESRTDGCTTRPGHATLLVGASGPCVANDSTLCLNGDRFKLTVAWKDYSSGASGSGHAVELTPDSGTFWFLSAPNLELFVKVLDGTMINGNYWVLYGALSDMEYTITVTDTLTGAVRTYFNPAHTQASTADVAAFSRFGAALGAGDVSGTEVSYGRLGALQAEGRPPEAKSAEVRQMTALAAWCTPSATSLCLGDGQRFRVRVTWWNYFNGTTGQGRAVPVTSDAGTFWFFSSSNVELVVKVLDGTGVNGRFWVLWGALTDVEYQVEVFDTRTGLSRWYYNPPRHLGSGSDTNAF